jgi:hypothetical protein
MSRVTIEALTHRIKRDNAMSRDVDQGPKEIRDIAAQLPDAHQGTVTSFDIKESAGYSEKLVDAIEMIGEEKAASFDGAGPSQVTPGMRYLHSSRTIHQLVTDRNRAVGIYLAVASLLLTASAVCFSRGVQTMGNAATSEAHQCSILQVRSSVRSSGGRATR